ncbi:hypothetical protein CLV85_2024 [Salinibacterium amurskyense]|uniref:Uncharacterized protein n=1 Tax=Salinibacterium amurskyense TaxID=205941 RepID=A0A2M9D315_9MICO|nr:hypothetical protein [Salinibacterium amurskyense]PJJ78453.1 hypothetical protein CLV85_2024 [Salinibacterium amurskyense]RLQ80551.1 hypothetical protein D9C83_10045 [Salinibacterium amurskyense]GHD83210.1 hypothetical protein GCM10007394_22190 [Salinibacterium amurskyense]
MSRNSTPYDLSARDPRQRITPPRSLFHRGVIAGLAFLGPVFGVLYIIVLPDGPWLAVVITQIVAILVAVGAIIAYFRIGIWFSPDAPIVSERGFFGRTVHFAKADAKYMLLAEVYTSDGLESRPTLAVMGADDRRLLRMRGQYWSPEHFDQVAAAFSVPTTRIPGTVSTGEVREDYPASLYFFERHPTAFIAVAIGATAATAAILMVALTYLRSLGA